jgi:cell division protein FtsZ
MDDFNNIADTSRFVEPDTDELPALIKVIGVGGGGTNAANYLYKQGISKVTFLACNTDQQALKSLDVPDKVLLGPTVTKGLGAGDDAQIGCLAGEESAEDIRTLLNDDTRMVFITAGMGGGTGTGAAPIVAQIAKEAGMLTVGIVTIPFFFEGQTKIYKALQGAEELRKYVDTLLMINNERLNEIYPDLNMINAFKKADDTLANAARSIANIINTKGYINADFNDVSTTLKDSSTAVISTGIGQGEHRVTKAIQDALNSPLLRNSDIRSSKRLLFYLYFNPKAENIVTMAEMNEITQFSANLNPQIKIKWGACWDESLGEDVRMTILASGFDLTVRDGKGDTITFQSDGGSTASEPQTPLKGSTGVADSAAPSTQDGPATPSILTIEEVYGAGKMKEHNQEMARAKYIVLDPAQFDDDDLIHEFEKSPAHSRSAKKRDEIRNIGLVKDGTETTSPQPAGRPATVGEGKAKNTPSQTKIVF